MKDDFLNKKLQERQRLNAYRKLQLPWSNTDFCSNDYLGLARQLSVNTDCETIFFAGATGSRLLAGNYALIAETEKQIAGFHEAEAGLIYNSGYDANIGLLSCVPQRGDTILYDYLSHASLRDGIRLSFATAYSFLHNSLEDLEKKIQLASGNIFVVTESVFSMDGDMAPLNEMIELCNRYGAHLIVDEAHATGVIGKRGEGLVQQLQLQHNCFARIHTFGKAVGCHGAIVLGSAMLREYLINFSRSFIYTTALPEAAISVVKRSYQLFPEMDDERKQLATLIDCFQRIHSIFVIPESTTPIQAVIVPGNNEVKNIAYKLQQHQLDVRPILYPTVPKGSERLRVVLHAFNTIQEVENLGHLLQ